MTAIDWERFDELRKVKGLTNRQLAIKAGISPSTLSTMRKNHPSDFTAVTLAALADQLGCSTDYLLGRTNVRKAESVPVDEKSLELARIIDALPKGRQREIREILDVFGRADTLAADERQARNDALESKLLEIRDIAGQEAYDEILGLLD